MFRVVDIEECAGPWIFPGTIYDVPVRKYVITCESDNDVNPTDMVGKEIMACGRFREEGPLRNEWFAFKFVATDVDKISEFAESGVKIIFTTNDFSWTLYNEVPFGGEIFYPEWEAMLNLE